MRKDQAPLSTAILLTVKPKNKQQIIILAANSKTTECSGGCAINARDNNHRQYASLEDATERMKSRSIVEHTDLVGRAQPQAGWGYCQRRPSQQRRPIGFSNFSNYYTEVVYYYCLLNCY